MAERITELVNLTLRDELGAGGVLTVEQVQQQWMCHMHCCNACN